MDFEYPRPWAGAMRFRTLRPWSSSTTIRIRRISVSRLMFTGFRLAKTCNDAFLQEHTASVSKSPDPQSTQRWTYFQESIEREPRGPRVRVRHKVWRHINRME